MFNTLDSRGSKVPENHAWLFFNVLDYGVDLCTSMANMGEILMSCVQETDSESSQKIASSYDQIMKACAGEPLTYAVIVLFFHSIP